MRTAEEIINEKFEESDPKDEIHQVYVRAVNQARIEAIEECAERATPDFTKNKYYNLLQVDKQSILSLINEVK